jgi:hypothetical protein
MTGIERRDGTPPGPPWSVDVLADLHAGVLDDAESAALWPRVRQDQDARSVLAALDATSAELAAFARQPIVPIPHSVAARLDAVMAAEANALFGNRAPAPVIDLAAVVDLTAARRRRGKRIGWTAGLVAAAAAVIGVVVVSLPHNGNQGTPEAAPPSTDGSAAGPPVALRGQLNAATVSAALGRADYGPLTEPSRRAACLAANGQNPDRTPAGAMRVTLNGTPGVLMVLPTGQLAQYRLLVVGLDCAAGHPDRLANTVIGGIGGLSPTPTR